MYDTTDVKEKEYFLIAPIFALKTFVAKFDSEPKRGWKHLHFRICL
jgi:hypothetical protein